MSPRGDREGLLRKILATPPGEYRVDDFTALLVCDRVALASEAKVHPSTMRHAPQSPSVQSFLAQIASVLRLAYDLSGDADKAVTWYKFEPLQPFSYKTPEQLLGTGRCDDLIAYLESISAGPLG